MNFRALCLWSFSSSLRRLAPLLCVFVGGCEYFQHEAPQRFAEEEQSAPRQGAGRQVAAEPSSGASESKEISVSIELLADPGPPEPAPAEPEHFVAEAKDKQLAKPAVDTRPAADSQRRELLSAAAALLVRGQLDTASARVDEALALGPTDEQRGEAEALTQDIKTRRQAVARLDPVAEKLFSESRRDVRAAENRLFASPDAALVLLLGKMESGEPEIARRALEMLRLLARPEVTLPAMVDLLADPDRAAIWPEVVRQIGLAQDSGAGEPLLQLALTTQSVESRLAALDALGRAADPPPQTAAALLPWLSSDGPELAPALAAAAHAVVVNGQYDLLALCGGELGQDRTVNQGLVFLPERLLEIIDSADDQPQAAAGAKALAIALRQLPAEPLDDVQVLAYSAELPDSSAQLALDGQSNTVDPKQMWRHALGAASSIVLDLGEEKTVVAVRIWNLNEPGGTQRGWKETAVYVGQTPTATIQPAGLGLVPQAPGRIDAADYSTTIPANHTRGRYVRLVAQSLWKEEGHTGLTEIEVLGY